MTSKNAKRKRDEHYRELSRHMRTVGETLTFLERSLQQLNPAVVATFHLGPFSGDPADFSITLIVQTEVDVENAQQTGLIDKARPLIESRLLQLGYLPEAVATFKYYLASEAAITKAGGRFNYFR